MQLSVLLVLLRKLMNVQGSKLFTGYLAMWWRSFYLLHTLLPWSRDGAVCDVGGVDDWALALSSLAHCLRPCKTHTYQCGFQGRGVCCSEGVSVRACVCVAKWPLDLRRLYFLSWHSRPPTHTHTPIIPLSSFSAVYPFIPHWELLNSLLLTSLH